ncbi:MAG: hypothetical protein EBU42_00970 [Synechococcus sp.]|nr:hypothetical protein [Synechococcus sp.]
MSTNDLVTELKAHIKELTSEKEELNKTVALKDSRIKQLLNKIEDANREVRAIAKKMEDCKEETEAAREETERAKKRIKQIKNTLGGGVLEEADEDTEKRAQSEEI